MAYSRRLIDERAVAQVKQRRPEERIRFQTTWLGLHGTAPAGACLRTTKRTTVRMDARTVRFD